jgi:hypothetical protein
MALSIRDLKEVRGLLHDFKLKWYDLGIELDVEVHELDVIRKEKDDHGNCLVEMLKLRLRFADKPLTWKILAKVLSGKVINEKKTAEKCRVYNDQ